MADNTDTVTTEKKEKKPLLPPLPPQEVTRGPEGDKVTLELKTYQIVKGDNEGTQYLAPEVTIGNLDEVIKWLGKSDSVNVFQTFLKRAFWQLWWANINKDGSFNMVAFLKGAEDITASAMKLADIRAKIDELQAQSSDLLDKGDIWKDKATGEKSPDLLKLEELNTEIRGYKDMEDKRSRKTDDSKPEAKDEPAVRR